MKARKRRRNVEQAKLEERKGEEKASGGVSIHPNRDWEGHAEDREHHPASHCGLRQTSLRGLSIDRLICLQPAQQNTTVLM